VVEGVDFNHLQSVYLVQLAATRSYSSPEAV